MLAVVAVADGKDEVPGGGVDEDIRWVISDPVPNMNTVNNVSSPIVSAPSSVTSQLCKPQTVIPAVALNASSCSASYLRPSPALQSQSSPHSTPSSSVPISDK